MVALSAPLLVWCCIIAIVITTIFCPIWIPLLLGGLLFVINSHYECYAYRGFFRTRRRNNTQCISVVTYNVNLAYNELSTQEKADKIADYLLKKDADIVFLQEYNPQVFPVLQQKLGGRYQYAPPYYLADRYKAVFSKYPLSDYIQLKDNNSNEEACIGGEDRSFLPICGMKVKVEDKSFYMVNCHLHSNNYSTAYRKFKRDELSLVNFISLTFSSLTHGIEERQRQVNTLREHLSNFSQPIIICGDMNDVSGSSVIKMLKGKNLCDAWWMKGKGVGYTLCLKVMKWRLDHIFFSKGIKMDSVMVDKYNMSDHCPLQCEFYLTPIND